MDENIKNFLIRKKYRFDDSAFNYFDLIEDWYTNSEKEYHKRVTINNVEYDLEHMNLAKRVCADDANLVEAVEINASKDKTLNDLVLDILKDNNFNAVYRKQIEELSAYGTVGAYPSIVDAEINQNTGRFSGGKIVLNYCNAKQIIPLKVVNDIIEECAFFGTEYRGDKKFYKVVIFEKNDEAMYVSRTYTLDSYGKEVKDEYQEVLLSETRPFAILRVAENNNLKMIGYGYPKLWSAIPILKIIDLTVTMWRRDLEKADKIILINEKLASRDKNGKPIPPTPEMKKIFVQIGQDKLPQEKSLYQEYNPTIRIADTKESLELSLSMLSLSFGYGTKKYTFENGRILSATEYVGERQDSMQEINKQRNACAAYINELVDAIISLYNMANGSNYVIDEVMVDFDDSYVEDRQAVAKRMRDDALSFGIEKLTLWYFMKQYNLTEKEAQELLDEMPSKDDGSQLEE